MEYIYTCERFNPYNSNLKDYIIADESGIISSPAYLHTFKDKISNEKYCIISDNIGIPMPYLKIDNEFIVGTSRYIYFFDVVTKKIERRILNSPCVTIIISQKKIIAICEYDVVVISVVDKHIIAEFEFNDVIIDYKTYKDYLLIYLLEGAEQKIDI